MSGFTTDYSYKITTAGGVDRWVAIYIHGDPLMVTNFSTSVAIGAYEAVSIDSTNTNIPLAPSMSAQTLGQVLYGLCTVSGAKNFLGVAMGDCPVKDTTKPIGAYTVPVAGAGSIVPVRSKQTLGNSTIGNLVFADSGTGLVDANTTSAISTILGSLCKAQATVTSWQGARDASATTAYFVGVYVNPR